MAIRSRTGEVQGCPGSGDSYKPMKRAQGAIQSNMRGEFMRSDPIFVGKKFAIQRAANKCGCKCQERLDCCNVHVKHESSNIWRCTLYKGSFGSKNDEEIESLSMRSDTDEVSLYKTNNFCQ